MPSATATSATTTQGQAPEITTLTGVGIGTGAAVGPVAFMAPALPEPKDVASTRSVDEETARVRTSVAVVSQELDARGQKAGGAAQEVLEAQAMMAEDPALTELIDQKIAAGGTAERAVFEAFSSFRAQLEALGGYLAERAADLDDVSQRVIADLSGVAAPGVPERDEPFILIARDLAPADTAVLDLDRVLALVTTDGGPTSHTAILAREKSIVAIVGTQTSEGLADGDVVVVDAATGQVTLNPDDALIEATTERIRARAAQAELPAEPGRLADGTPLPLLANLGDVAGAAPAVARGAEGVGLFRTEFLFLDSTTAPTVADQRASYTALLEAFPGKKVVVRLLDAGADKPLPFLNDAHEENPAMGLRGLRALRASENLLRDQLTALAEADAATSADLWVMAPMVSTVEETVYFVTIAAEYGIRTAGVMVEVPSAALLADRILPHAAFASIGTNDLTQYTLAADRQLGSVAAFQSPWHPAVLRLIQEVARAGESTGKPVGVCGEAAADPLLAIVLAGLGVTSLSMSPAALADVRASLLTVTLDEARTIAESALAADEAADAKTAALAAATRITTKEN